MQKLEDKISDYIVQQGLFKKSDHLLLALSGGKDSVALFHVLLQLNYRFSVAHVNYNLRDEDADADEKFCHELCNRHGIPFYVKSIDTKNEKLRGESIQMTARRLRYTFFKELLEQEEPNILVTAHNSSDQAETILLNLTKGTGIKGLRGIPAINNQIRRPLLCATEKEVKNWLKNHSLQNREDASNESNKYQRNRLRHNVLPELRNINPQFDEGMFRFSRRMAELENWVRQQLKKEIKEQWRAHDDFWIYRLESENLDSASFFLKECLLPLGFSESDVNQILHAKTGAAMQQGVYGLFKNRNEIWLGQSMTGLAEEKTALIQYETEKVSNSLGEIKSSLSDLPKASELKKPQLAFLNADKLNYPLQLRRWREGDSFKPYGTKSKQLVSDFLINEKVAAPLKERVMVLVSAEEIAWLVNFRIADGFKIDKFTESIVRLEWVPKVFAPFDLIEKLDL